jgi:ribosomal protein L11 methyltransferase
MRYIEVDFTIKGGEEWQEDLFVQELATLGFDSFEDKEGGFYGYIPEAQFDAGSVDQLIFQQPEEFQVSYTSKEIAQENWNAVWESNFRPISIDNACYVRATFHDHQPDFPLEIVIDPKMAFGTGHHQTTSMMMRFLLKLGGQGLRGKSLLDMGCGTGILAILASKLGADPIWAIDFDEICVASTEENAGLNGVNNINVKLGSAPEIPELTFDYIFANINRNILLDHLESYERVLKPEAKLFLSGFYENPDLAVITEKATSLGLKFEEHLVDGGWAAALFSK